MAFAALHEGEPFLIPNPWDAGSARVLEALGFRALATTSSGFAFTLGRLDGGATGDEVAASSAATWAATSSIVAPPSRRPSVKAKPELVVASARKLSASSTRAEPASQGFGIRNGSPSWRAANAAAFSSCLLASDIPEPRHASSLESYPGVSLIRPESDSKGRER